MRDRGTIWCGLAAFLAFATFPMWHNLSAAVTAKGPEPVLPAAGGKCVLPTEQMKASHMTLLLDWRQQVVRAGVRDYAAPDGRHFNMSLTGTCLRQCHSAGKAEFCDKCHNYEAVGVPCWDCHTDSKAALGGSRW